MTTDAGSARTYAGRSVADRRAERRRRFVDAAIEVFGTSGYAGSSVTALCREAGLSRRQFYEEFTDRESLLLTAYDEIQAHARAEIGADLAAAGTDDIPTLARVAMTAFMRSFGTDRRRAAIVFVEIVGVSPRVEDHRLAGREVWVDFFGSAVRDYTGRPAGDAAEDSYRAIGFVGALTAVVYRWSTDGPDRPDLDAIVDVLAQILLAFIRI
ncbi:TetR/AcrR family transcriptional regulator [uncultured Williamsia sp.]|uniref:TetR/AcrR family transcriptional regulator n=1 Tax=uncultured Williamsia sp. TaxID=259311 RepID=UPI0026352914|nr:TetR/AcrR family transcriptional regulator [uncultured Williamsia sp.]